jgi:DNA-binding beta-propeller fold protein YncE
MRCTAALLSGFAALGTASWAHASDHLFVVTSYLESVGNCAAVELEPPWNSSTNLEMVGPVPAVEHAGGLHYVVNAFPADNLQIIDPDGFTTVRTIAFTPGSNPQHVLVVGDGTALVSFWDQADLLRIDLVTEDVVAAFDLSGFADSDGLPEMGRMARDGDHAFVQITRIDRSPMPEPRMKGALAVIDLSTNTIVDTDGVTAGVQPIELAWYEPSLAMQIEGRRLYVSEPGAWKDQSGGIEAINLDTLEPLGLVYVEKEIGAAQIGAFLFVSPTRGYFVHHTDFALSSHLVSFSRVTNSFLAEHFVTFAFVERLAFDPVTNLIYFPDSGFAGGIRVFDAATGDQLTEEAVDTGLPPVDLVIARSSGTDALPAPAPSRAAAWAFPNPTVGAASIHVTGRAGSELGTLTLVDATGARLASLAPATRAVSGARFDWDGRDEGGARVSPGVYFYRVEGTSGAAATGRVVVVR